MCIFFFCKQKTAYEMRISDWSSDVCSSDLERHLERRALRLARVERDGEQQEAREVGGARAVVQDPVVPGVVEAEIREVPQRRMGVADAVQEPDVRLDVAGTVPVPGADLVLLRVEVFLLARDRLGLAELEAVVHADRKSVV